MDLLEYEAIVEAAVATTYIDNQFSIYDLNKDHKISGLDLAAALLYIEYRASDHEWDTLVRVIDARRDGITPRRCDVNGDGIVNMLDLMLVLINYN